MSSQERDSVLSNSKLDNQFRSEDRNDKVLSIGCIRLDIVCNVGEKLQDEHNEEKEGKDEHRHFSDTLDALDKVSMLLCPPGTHVRTLAHIATLVQQTVR